MKWYIVILSCASFLISLQAQADSLIKVLVPTCHMYLEPSSSSITEEVSSDQVPVPQSVGSTDGDFVKISLASGKLGYLKKNILIIDKDRKIQSNDCQISSNAPVASTSALGGSLDRAASCAKK